MSWANPTRSHYKVVVRREPASKGNDVRGRVWDGLDPIKGMPKVEKVFGQEMGVCVNNFAIENFVTNN